MEFHYDLVDIAKSLQKKRVFIVVFTLIAAITGAVIHFISEKKYRAFSEFSITNPQFADRNNIFRTTELRTLDFYGNEDDIDHVMGIAKSNSVQGEIITRLDLFKAYGLDANNEKDQEKLGARFKSRYEVIRTENKNIEISYKDPDAKLAAKITNMAVEVIEQKYREFYNDIKNRIYGSIDAKLKETDSSLSVYTDSLAHLRDRYGIYDIVNPNRPTMSMGGVKGSGGKDFGMAMEVLQNVEAVKDQLVADKAKYISLLNEFSTGTKLNDLKFLHVVSQAYAPSKPTGLGGTLTTIACALVGFFISVMIVLVTGYYKALVSFEK